MNDGEFGDRRRTLAQPRDDGAPRAVREGTEDGVGCVGRGTLGMRHAGNMRGLFT
jgi:hypothetical protein